MSPRMFSKSSANSSTASRAIELLFRFSLSRDGKLEHFLPISRAPSAVIAFSSRETSFRFLWSSLSRASAIVFAPSDPSSFSSTITFSKLPFVFSTRAIASALSSVSSFVEMSRTLRFGADSQSAFKIKIMPSSSTDKSLMIAYSRLSHSFSTSANASAPSSPKVLSLTLIVRRDGQVPKALLIATLPSRPTLVDVISNSSRDGHFSTR
mmetsp:Transcript_38961/g.154178  ORF Transcript_38961/g.154178 Transcript_38961/m.154178 type:complete len:209 (+) Transcript_38961:843-1469(+)